MELKAIVQKEDPAIGIKDEAMVPAATKPLAIMSEATSVLQTELFSLYQTIWRQSVTFLPEHSEKPTMAAPTVATWM